MKILLSEAENWVEAGRTKIYGDARSRRYTRLVMPRHQWKLRQEKNTF